MFFEDFEKINYSIDGINHMVTNIVAANMVNRWIIDDTYSFRKYKLQSTDTPEKVSFDLYGTTRHYWTLYVVNNIVNPFKDWPIHYLREYIEKKYDDIDGIHHFINIKNGLIVDDLMESKLLKLDPSEFPKDIMPITNYEYEFDLNMKKLEIMVIGIEHINKFTDDYKQALKESK